MKKFSLLLIMLVATLTLNAQVFTEYFKDAPTGGNLEDYNEWYVSFKSADANGVSPVISEEILFYDGYAGSDIGKTAKLDSLVGMESATQRISTKVVTFGPGDTLRPVIGGSMYAAFMVSIGKDSKNSYRDFFTWEGSTGSSWQRGRVFVDVDNDTDLKFAVSKNSSSGADLDEAMIEILGGVDVYHLLVLKYEAIDGANNDVITLFVNPDPAKSEAEQVNQLVAFDTQNQSDYSEGTEIKINLRQRGVGALVGGIRVGRNWEAVLKGGSQEVSVTGVSLDQETLTLDAGTTGTLVATVAPEDATNTAVAWSSNNEAVATVADGVVNAVAAGEATITVTTEDGGFTANCVVTVNSGVGVNNIETSGFSMYPNPVSDGILNIKIPEANKAKSIEIYNVLGVLVHREKVENKSAFQLNTAGILKQGIYFVKVDSNNGSRIEQLIIE